MEFIQMGSNEFYGPLENRFDELNAMNETGLNNLIAMAVDDNTNYYLAASTYSSTLTHGKMDGLVLKLN